MFYKLSGLIILAVFITACSDEQSTMNMQQPAKQQMVMENAPVRNMNFSQITHGGQIFNKNCATCHGNTGQGALNWQQKGPDGKPQAPPLNGTGHAWHHPYVQLKRTIKQGTQQIGGSMPAWNEKLSEQDIDDVMAWFMSKWPDEIYTAWYKRNEKNNRGG